MLLLLKKNEGPKALCSECGHLHEPSSAELESQGKKSRPVFICKPCMVKIDQRFEWLNSPKRWAMRHASL